MLWKSAPFCSEANKCSNLELLDRQSVHAKVVGQLNELSYKAMLPTNFECTLVVERRGVFSKVYIDGIISPYCQKEKILKTYRIPLVVLALIVAALACQGSLSTANIANAYTTANPNGGSPTTLFAPDQVFYAIVELKNAPDDTTVKAVWTAVNVEDVEPNTYLMETSLTSGSGTLTFELSNDALWPAGQYKVDLYLNDKLDRSLTFEVR